jgi:hypothetical protein
MNIIKAIIAINPSARVSVNAEDYEQITWHDGTTPISEADIRAKIVELQAEYETLDYARKRKAEYPSVQDLVVALYDTDDKAAIEAKRAEVKLKYPKP